MTRPLRIGLIGCGAISGAYLSHARTYPSLQFTACCDLDVAKAKAKAAEFQIPRVLSFEEILRDPHIDIILNLTVPGAHAEISLRALEAGKHVYSEKPLAISLSDGQRLLDVARQRNLRLACAPDTFLGSGLQTARKLIDDNGIGRPVAFTAFMMCPGHEHWHPSPQFFYEVGGGPMFDMGPYYLTALLNFFGPIRRVSALAATAIATRHTPQGQRIEVQTPDHITGSIEFQSGVVGTLITSFAIRFPQYDTAQPITIYGTEGTVKVPDPNQFDGPVHLRRSEDPEFGLMPPGTPLGRARSIGLADLADAIDENRQHRAGGEQAFAVLEAMQGFLDSARDGRAVETRAGYHRPEPMP
jgi:predicted dehydrogenase